MFKNLVNKKKDEGFTIIEVLIVLAIAGLILVVVLIAIPQLQRNQRNTARQNDASRVGTSVSNFMANNNGQPPVSTDLATIITDLEDLSQYEISTDLSLTGYSADVAETDEDNIQIITGAKCEAVTDFDHDGDTSTDGITGQAAVDGTSRQVAVIYANETGGGGTQPACVDV